jgi:hypothetical protein
MPLSSPAIAPMPARRTTLDWLALAFAALPVWWAIGLEQVIWSPLALVAAAWVIRVRGPLPLRRVPWWFAAFLVLHLAAVTSVDTTERYLTFARTLYGYGAPLGLALLLAHPAVRAVERRRLIVGVVVGMVGAGVLAVLAFSGWRLAYALPWRALVPAGLLDSMLVERHVTRAIGTPDWFLGVPYLRPHATFLFATSLGLATAATLPLALGAARTATGARRWAALAAAAVILTALLATTARASVGGVLVAGVLVALLAPSTRRFAGVALLLAVLAAGAWAVVERDRVAEAATTLIEARGTSAEDRAAIYVATVELWTERPFRGYGTERDVEGVKQPAGSHSYPLGVLFKYGLGGFLALLGSAVAATVAVVRATWWGVRWAPWVAWGWMGLAIATVLEAPDLDLSTLAIVSVGWAAARTFAWGGPAGPIAAEADAA